MAPPPTTVISASRMAATAQRSRSSDGK
jgi:hypothetical protein